MPADIKAEIAKHVSVPAISAPAHPMGKPKFKNYYVNLKSTLLMLMIEMQIKPHRHATAY
jgi:hypothetical protein